MAFLGQLRYVLAGTILMTLNPLFVKLSQNADGKIEYNTASAVLCMEALKICISLVMLMRDTKLRTSSSFNLQEFFEYAVPALIFFINNNLTFSVLSRLDAATFQIVSQLKTVFTAVLFRLVLQRKLAPYQFLAVGQLACGTAVSQLVDKADGRDTGTASFTGFMLAVLQCLLSSLGGIYNEKLLKQKDKNAIHWQNTLLYVWGIIFNVIAYAMNGAGDFSSDALFAGYNSWTWVVIVNNALTGLAISAILKFADNIARVFASAAAMLLTMLVAVVFFNEPITAKLVLALMVVSMSVMQYNMTPSQLGIEARSPVGERKETNGEMVMPLQPHGEGKAQRALKANVGSRTESGVVALPRIATPRTNRLE
eukprot:TRINITY_DN19604_c1_g1_i1.p1 TRINITY_DN19604_c1_g1~~TRINITY_DN19604_c1_g1_i1.p1  ORF type:complete len:376 (+),score=71.61 TRINITY_DN19604_c1_g1_i1:26-1129(+)